MLKSDLVGEVMGYTAVLAVACGVLYMHASH